MNILFLSYGRFEYDGRQRELIKVCKQLGKTYYLTCAGEDYVPAEPEAAKAQDAPQAAKAQESPAAEADETQEGAKTK